MQLYRVITMLSLYTGSSRSLCCARSVARLSCSGLIHVCDWLSATRTGSNQLNQHSRHGLHNSSTKLEMTHLDNYSYGIRGTAFWLKKWQDGDTFWHKDTVHPFLEKYVGQLIGGKQKARVFFPLCGKSNDLKWIADQGHTVVGVEACQSGIESFFTEHNLPYTRKTTGDDITLYQSLDEKIGRIFIYCSDMFQLNASVLGQFDAIWDRGSLAAIDTADQGRYSSLLKSLMLPDCRYLVEVHEYDQHLYSGPPSNIPKETVAKLFAPLTVHVLECIEDETRGKKYAENFTYFRRNYLMLTSSANSLTT